MEISEALSSIKSLGSSKEVTEYIREAEKSLVGAQRSDGSNDRFDSYVPPLEAAIRLKRVAGRVNDLVHTFGIAASLPHILDAEETVQAVSLASGNTGKLWDLETDIRVAEFKFIEWQGGSEAIRQNGLFKDFYHLSEAEESRKRYLYVTGMYHPLRFLRNSQRTLKSVTSGNSSLRSHIEKRYPIDKTRVCDYFEQHQHNVNIVDLLDLVPDLRRIWDTPE